MNAGTRPPGAQTETEAARWVRAMFDRVAHRYDLLNHLLSFNRDRRWRARTVVRVQHALARPGARALDLCCGTGDLLIALRSAAPAALVCGSDFSRAMLEAARRKDPAAVLMEADALALPLAVASLDLVSVAFGLRNLANYKRGLREMRRVLRPGGLAAILEFSQPPSRAFAALYDFYSRRVLPAVGGALSGARDAYLYLPDSVRRFPAAEELAAEMGEAGFREVRFERMTGGVVALHLGTA